MGIRQGLHQEEEERAMAKDPVCHMEVEPAKAAAQSSYQGQTYYFCAVGCKQKFDRNPETYLTGGTVDKH
jgi:YHS domain-containing protein